MSRFSQMLAALWRTSGALTSGFCGGLRVSHEQFPRTAGLSISGTVETFDRVIFKGHLNGFFPSGAFGRYLWRRDVLLKDAGQFFKAEMPRKPSSRLIAKLRGHGLITRVKNSRLYRLTARGLKAM